MLTNLPTMKCGILILKRVFNMIQYIHTCMNSITHRHAHEKNLFDNMLITSQQASVHFRQLCPKHKGQNKNYVEWM